MLIKDDFKHQGLRRRMIESLKEILPDVSDNVFEAMNKVPRHLFVGDSAFLNYAYKPESAFKIAGNQTISRPTTVAIQTSLLQLKPSENVLEIGTGSGYQTAVLCAMGVKVFSIERQKVLFDKTINLLRDLNYKATLFFGDGYEGRSAFAPFDKIIVTCGAPYIPPILIEQLKVGGIMVIPVGEGVEQEMHLITKLDAENNYSLKTYGRFAFVPMIQNKAL